MIYYLYEIKNKINGKIYVGVHKTENINDGYMGSGKIIKKSIKKYGIHNFEKTILETFDCEEEMFLREKEIVNGDFILRDDVYNLRYGGSGGWDFVHKSGLTNKNKPRSHYIKIGKIGNEKHKKMLSNAEYKQKWCEKIWHSQSEETKEKISNSLKGRKRNRVWINNGIINKYHNIDIPYPEGFIKGRIKIR